MGSLYFAIIVLSTACFSFWLRCCKEENYLSAPLLTIFLYLFGFILDLLKGYAGSGFWLDFSGFTFFLDPIFFFLFCFFKTDKLNFLQMMWRVMLLF